MKSRDEPPSTLGDLLNTLAGRLRKVDLREIDEIRTLWPSIVDPVIAEHCRPEFVKNGVLLVSVPSGAFAQRIASDATTILGGFSSLGERAPKSLRTVLAKS
jgi:predicted nucleic acid-binding Zn ribbon protein